MVDQGLWDRPNHEQGQTIHIYTSMQSRDLPNYMVTADVIDFRWLHMSLGPFLW